MNTAEFGSVNPSAIETYWRQKCRGRTMPSRADIDPGEIPRLLPNVLLLDVLRDPPNLRYRLVGTAIEEQSSLGNITGKLITELPDRAPPSKVWDNLWSVVDSAAPSHSSVPYVGPKRDFVTTRQVVLPLADDGERVDMLLVFIEYLTARTS